MLSSVVYAGHMGWVEEDNELRASYPDKTWWLTGNRARLSTYIANMDETRTMEGAYADVFLVSPSGERINVTRIRVREAYPLRAGEMRSFEVEWDSTGYEPGYYRLEMVGEADFEYGDDKELSNFMDGAVKLFAWDHPVFRPRVVEVDLPKTEFVPGEPFTCDVTVENQGNVPVFPVTFMTLRGENETVWRPQMMDEPGVIYKEGERYTSHFKTWLPAELPPGTFSCEVNVFCFAAWPSTDGSGWTPWPTGDCAYNTPWPEYTGELYYPYPMEDPFLGYPLVLGNETWLYLPWPAGGYDGVWPWPEDVSLSLPGDDSPCTEAAECGEGVFGWSEYLCEYSYGPSTCQSWECGEIEVEAPVYSCEILDYAFTELPLPLGEESILLAEVSNDGNTPVETDWYIFTLEDESIVTVESLPSVLEPDCDTVVQLYTEFDDIEPGDYTLEIHVEGHLPWPADVGEWMRTEYIPEIAGFLFDDGGLVDPEAWLNYPNLDEVFDLWPTFNDPSQVGGCPLEAPPGFDSMDSFFDVNFDVDLSGTPLITDSPSPVLVGIEEPDSPGTETPPEGEPRFSDWLIGDTIAVTATIYNTGDLPIVSELGTVFGTMPTGVTFVIGSIEDSASIGSGDYKEYPFVWSSEGAPAGTYSMSLGGAVSFSDGSGQMLYNFEPNAWILVDPDPPEVATEVLDPTPLWFNYMEGDIQMDAEIVIQNTGASQILEVQYEAKLYDADGNEVATDSGTVGTSGPSLAGPGEETSFTTSFVSEGFAPGDYSLQVTVTTTDEHGDQVTNDITAENYFHVDPINPEFLILDPTPLWFSYLEGAYQVDAEIEIQNTGNSPVQKIDYEAKLFDSDGNEVATDSGSVETSGPSLAGPGEKTSFTTSFVSDGFAAGDYSLQVTVTTTDEFGNQVSHDLSAEDYFSVDPLNPDFDFTEVSPNQDTYTLGPDPQMDTIILLGNTGNVPLYSFNYVVELLDADGNVVATDSGTRETSSGPLVEPGEVDQVTASFFTDELAAGDYSVRVSVTGVDADGTEVTNKMFVEDMFHVEALNPEFLILDPTPLWYHHLEGDYQVDAEIEIQNTGNSQVQKIDYEAKLFDSDGNEVATDSGSVETSGPSLAGPGEKTSFTTSFVSDGFAAGEYSVQVTATTTDEFGNQVTHDLSAEDYFIVDPLNPDFDFTEVSPGQETYVDGEDLQVDAIVLLKNTGNVPLYSFDYKVELLDADGNVVATDTGTRETSSGPLVEPGEEDQVTGSFLTDDLAAGDYSVRVSVTGVDAKGTTVTNDMFVEDMIKIEASNPDFDFTEVSPGQDSYVDGEDLQVDAIVLLQNTGNVPLYSFDYKVELLDSDGNVVATDTGTRETSSGPLVEPGEGDQVTGSFLTDDLAAGDYSVRVSVTGVDSEGGTVTSDTFVEDMIKIAENPDDLVTDSGEEKTTTGIPGFPLGSIIAGLAVVILLQYLSHSRRG